MPHYMPDCFPHALLTVVLTCSAAWGAPPRERGWEERSRSLEVLLLRAVREARFEQVLDWRRKGQRVAHMPQVDLAVIELDAEGRPLAAANVLLSRDYPKGRAVPIDSRTLGTQAVRFTRWDLERWEGKKPWVAPPEEDLVPGRERAALRFMSPYPASLFKLLIAFHVLRLVDRGELSLDTPYHFLRAEQDKGERLVREWLEPMVVESDNGATEALVKLLHERGAMPSLNAELAALGLATLQVNDTSPVTGRSWNPGSIHMTALDTARLLLLVNGGPGREPGGGQSRGQSRGQTGAQGGEQGVLWRTPEGHVVSTAALSQSSRHHLQRLLAAQGLKEGLSSTLVCGAPHARPGIPAAMPERWLSAQGTATVAGISFGHDTRPCNAAAEVEFLHKTGLTENYGSDAGIVRSLPGKPQRHYVISFLSSLGYRYYDEEQASAADFSDEENGFPGLRTNISYTQRVAALGRAVDEGLRRRAASHLQDSNK